MKSREKSSQCRRPFPVFRGLSWDLENVPIPAQCEEEELIRKAQAGSIEARNRIVEGHLRFLISISNEYKGQSLDREELVNAGVLGLCEGIAHYDASLKKRLLTYAVFFIRRHMREVLRKQQGVVCFPHNKFNAMTRVADALRTYNGEFSDSAVAAVASDTGMTRKKAERILVLLRYARALSIDAPAGHDGDPRCLKEFLKSALPSSAGLVASQEREELVAAALRSLGKVERAILEKRFGFADGDTRSFRDIAVQMRLSQRQTRRIYCSALAKLKLNKKIEAARRNAL